MPRSWINAVVVAVVLVALRWLTRGSTKIEEPGKLVYGSKLRLVSVILVVAPAVVFGGAALASPPTNRSDAIAVTALTVGLPLAALGLVLEFYRVTIAFDETGIQFCSPWSRRRTLLWRDIRSVRWRGAMRWLDLRDGQNVVHLSPWLTGLDEFARACRSRIPAGLVLDVDTASVFVLMEEGRAGEMAWSQKKPSVVLGYDPRQA